MQTTRRNLLQLTGTAEQEAACSPPARVVLHERLSLPGEWIDMARGLVLSPLELADGHRDLERKISAEFERLSQRNTKSAVFGGVAVDQA